MKKKSFTQELFSRILNEKNLNTKNVIIAIIIIIIIGIIGVCISKSSTEIEDDMAGVNYFTPKYNKEVLEDTGYSLVEIEDMDEDTLFETANDIIIKTSNQQAGDTWAKELTFNESRELKSQFYQYAISGDYNKIINTYEDLLLNKSLLEPYNKSLIRIYNDACLIKSALSDKNNLTLAKNTLKNINDERMLLTVFLKSSLKARNETLIDRLSLTVSSETKNLRINSISSSTMRYSASNNEHKDDVNLNKMFNHLNEGDYIVYKINFTLDSDTFNAYMFKNLNNLKLSIYGIYAEDEQTASKFNTVVQSDELQSSLHNYNSSRDEYFESIKNKNNNLDNSEDTTNNSEDTEYTEILDMDEHSHDDGVILESEFYETESTYDVSHP